MAVDGGPVPSRDPRYRRAQQRCLRILPAGRRNAAKLEWELIGYNQTNAIFLTDVPPETERQVIHDTLGTIEVATGKRPVGWLAGPG